MKKVMIVISFLLVAIGAKSAEISVQGNCVKKIDPDVFSINIEVFDVNKELDKSFKNANKKFRDVVNYYKIKFDIQTESVNTHEEYDYQNRERIFKGHKTVMRASLETRKKEDLEKAIYSLSQFQDTKVSGLMTRVSRKKMKQERDSCFLVALDDARKKAKKVAKSINEKVKKISKIKEIGDTTGRNHPTPIFRTQGVKALESTPIEVRGQDLEVSVLLEVKTE